MTTTPTPPAVPVRRPKRRLLVILFAMLAVGLGLVVALIGVELVLRVYDPLPHPLVEIRWLYRLDEHGRVELTPDWQGSQHLEGRSVAITMNSLGLRGPEPGPRVAGQKRVLMVGDSFVFGQGVDDEHAIGAQLQVLLNGGGEQVLVGNAGITGTGPREWAYTVERFRDSFQPDAVVAVLYVGNDVLDTLQEPLSAVSGWLLTSDYAKVARKSWRFRMRVASRLWDKVEHALGSVSLFAMAEIAPIGPGIPLGEALFLDGEPRNPAEVAFVGSVQEKLGAHFREFARATQGLPTLVVLLPSQQVAVEDYEKVVAQVNLGFPPAQQLQAAQLVRGVSHTRLAQWLQAAGLAVTDFGERIVAAPERRSWYLMQDRHFNDVGCGVIASWLLEPVRALLR